MRAEETASIAKPIIYHDRHFNIDAAKIGPGEYYITQRDMMIVTVLGSCVSACMRDPVAKVGGMNHFMLPTRDAAGPLSESARYGAYAMEVLINKLFALARSASGWRRRCSAQRACCRACRTSASATRRSRSTI